jgi:hypothetical protein
MNGYAHHEAPCTTVLTAQYYSGLELLAQNVLTFFVIGSISDGYPT